MKTNTSRLSLACGFGAALLMSTAPIAQAADTDVLPATGDKVETFISTKYWTVFKNNTRQSCFIEWRAENSVVQAGLTLDQNAGYLGAFLKDADPQAGDQDVAIVLNGNVYVGSASTVSGDLSGGLKGGYIVVDNPRFLSDLEEAREFVAFQGAPYTVTVKLKTPKNAVERARECMETF